MRYIRYAVLAILAIILIVVALANNAPVTLRLLPGSMSGFLGWTWSVTLPLFLVILASVATGVLIGFVWEFAREHKQRVEARHRRKEKDQLRRENDQLRNRQARREGDDVLALLEDGSTPR